MKNLIIITFLISTLSSCLKREKKWEGNTSIQYTITGKLYSKVTMLPIKGFGVAIRQSDKSFNQQEDYKVTDPHCYTDSAGYFSISYYPTTYNSGINLYKVPDNYSCCIDLEILDNIQKGANLDVGIIYY